MGILEILEEMGELNTAPVGHGDTEVRSGFLERRRWHTLTHPLLSLSLGQRRRWHEWNGQADCWICLLKEGGKEIFQSPTFTLHGSLHEKRPFAWELMELVLAKCCVCLLGCWHMFFLLGPIHLSTHHADFFGFGLIWSVHRRWYVCASSKHA